MEKLKHGRDMKFKKPYPPATAVSNPENPKKKELAEETKRERRAKVGTDEIRGPFPLQEAYLPQRRKGLENLYRPEPTTPPRSPLRRPVSEPVVGNSKKDKKDEERRSNKGKSFTTIRHLHLETREREKNQDRNTEEKQRMQVDAVETTESPLPRRLLSRRNQPKLSVNTYLAAGSLWLAMTATHKNGKKKKMKKGDGLRLSGLMSTMDFIKDTIELRPRDRGSFVCVDARAIERGGIPSARH
jgi:hypothetical protein